MKKKLFIKLCYYSYIIVFTLFIAYLLIYAFMLKDSPVVYYKYLLIFFAGILLGYIVADSSHRYLKKSNEKIKLLSKFTSIMLVIMIIVLVISFVFHDELLYSGFHPFFMALEAIVLFLWVVCEILYFISKR